MPISFFIAKCVNRRFGLKFPEICSYGNDECLEAFVRNRQAVFFKRDDVTFNGLFDIGNGFLPGFSLTDATG